MSVIQIKDKRFKTFIPEEKILQEVARVAGEINRDLKDCNPLFLSVLNGSFMFTADLMKHLEIPCEISFVKLASYEGTSSSGKVKELVGLNESIEDKLKVDLDIHYVAMNIPNDFIVGYGLDYDGLGRNYRDIYTVIE